MNVRTRVAAGLGSTLLVLGAGAGPAAAARPGSAGPPAQGPGSAAMLSYLGLTQAQLKTGLQNGQTLAEVATVHGKTVSGLEAAIVADAKTHLDAAVAAGKLTLPQEATILADLSSHVADRVTAPGPPTGDSSATP